MEDRSMPTEESMVRRAQDGDREAFAEIVRLHQSRVRSFLGRYSRDHDTVDDLSQDVFLSAYTSLRTYKGDSPLSTWLFGIARHRALTFLRDESRRKGRLQSRFEAALAEWRTRLHETDAADDAIAERRTAALVDCIERLPGKSARLVNLFYFARKSTAEIAKLLGMKGGTVRMGLTRVRAGLQHCVEACLDEAR
jgi:RNA polymerase sigma-70 factor (ECF subfamily)